MKSVSLDVLYNDSNSLTRNVEIYLASKEGWANYDELLKVAQEQKFAKGTPASEHGLRIALTRADTIVSDEAMYNFRLAALENVKNKPTKVPTNYSWNKQQKTVKHGWRGRTPSDPIKFYQAALDRRDALNEQVLNEARAGYINFLCGELPGVSVDVITDAVKRKEDATVATTDEVEAA